MPSFKYEALVVVLALASTTAAHGLVSGVVADGIYYPGYSPNFQYLPSAPKVIGWSIPQDQSLGFVNDYTSPDIICHLAATPGQAYAKVSAGSTIDVQWTPWPASHRGPMLDYLAPCGDDCTTVDKTKLLWTKIDEAGLTGPSSNPQKWASDDMIANNNTWAVTIPASIAPGKYVLRHETIALHSAGSVGGAQNYPQCLNLEITGSGTNNLASGTTFDKLYTAQDPGILINIYQTLKQYVVPGPAVMAGAGSGSNPPVTTAPPTPSIPPSSTGPFNNHTVSSKITVSTKPTTFTTLTKATPSRSPSQAISESTSKTALPSSPSTTLKTITTASVTKQPFSEVSDTKVGFVPISTDPAATADDAAPVTTALAAIETDAPSVSAGADNEPPMTRMGRKFVCYEEEEE